MCGIVGFVGFNATGGAPARRVLQAMTDAILHRGPDAEGHWIDTNAEVALGHRRLSIVDLSSAGAQPMQSHSGRYVVVFNGEIYNHFLLRQDIDRNGSYAWRGHSDTETLLAGFDFWGIESTIRRCIGMFAIAVWDRGERHLYLIRDRIGEKPLYYGWQGMGTGRTFLFGSEIKALRRHPAFDARVDRAALANYVERMVIGGTASIYSSLRKVSPGSMIVLDPTNAEPRQIIYWSATDAAMRGVANRFTGTSEEAVSELDLVLGDSVALQMGSDVPVGSFLSGGIDSSTIAAIMQAQSTKPIRTFAIGFREKEFNEAPYAKSVAKHLGTEHTEIFVDAQQTRDLIPRLAQVFDEPFADSSALPTLLLSQITRQHVGVALSGDAGDELFCGYRRYNDALLYWQRIKSFPISLRNLCAATIQATPVASLNSLGHLAGYQCLGDQLHKGAPILASADQYDLYKRMLRSWPGTNPVLDRPEHCNTHQTKLVGCEGLSESMEQFMLTDILQYLPDDILTKVDRAAMSASLEVRIPLLDYRVVEFAWRIPLHWKRHEQQGSTTAKWLLRQVLYRYVPSELVDRPKMGFSVPLAGWLRGELRGWAEELLDEHRLRTEGYFNVARVRRLWSQHLDGQHNWQAPLWAILMFQAWLSEWPSTPRHHA